MAIEAFCYLNMMLVLSQSGYKHLALTQQSSRANNPRFVNMNLVVNEFIF